MGRQKNCPSGRSIWDAGCTSLIPVTTPLLVPLKSDATSITMDTWKPVDPIFGARWWGRPKAEFLVTVALIESRQRCAGAAEDHLRGPTRYGCRPAPVRLSRFLWGDAQTHGLQVASAVQDFRHVPDVGAHIAVSRAVPQPRRCAGRGGSRSMWSGGRPFAKSAFATISPASRSPPLVAAGAGAASRCHRR